MRLPLPFFMLPHDWLIFNRYGLGILLIKRGKDKGPIGIWDEKQAGEILLKWESECRNKAAHQTDKSEMKWGANQSGPIPNHHWRVSAPFFSNQIPIPKPKCGISGNFLQNCQIFPVYKQYPEISLYFILLLSSLSRVSGTIDTFFIAMSWNKSWTITS